MVEDQHIRKRSYRQIGTYTVDKTRYLKGREAIESIRSTPSIPPKYPVPLNPQSLLPHPKAFNVSDQRFTSNLPLVPGPGAHFHMPSMVKTEASCPSISKKGYTSLASKSSRFDTSTELENRLRPGPGAYAVTSLCLDNQSNKKKGQSLSAAFVKGRRSRCEEALVALPEGPGAGRYNTRAAELSTLPNTHNGGCAFKSTSRRTGLNVHGLEEVPAPGRYQVGQALDFLAKQGMSTRPSSSFISRASRILVLGNNHAPSPGTYDVGRAETALRGSHPSRGRCASAFTQGNQDRFGHPIHPLVLHDEPAAFYHHDSTTTTTDYVMLRSKSKKPSLLLTSAFRSGTQRLGQEVGGIGKRPPGPAYYKPEVDVGRNTSFFFNSYKRFVV